MAGAVIAALDFESVMVISDIITAESRAEDIYTEIKNRLISTFAISSEDRLRQLIKGELPGDQNHHYFWTELEILVKGNAVTRSLELFS